MKLILVLILALSHLADVKTVESPLKECQSTLLDVNPAMESLLDPGNKALPKTLRTFEYLILMISYYCDVKEYPKSFPLNCAKALNTQKAEVVQIMVQLSRIKDSTPIAKYTKLVRFIINVVKNSIQACKANQK